MANPIDFSKLLNDPAFQDVLMNMQNIPLQPNVEGISSSMAMTELPQSEKEIQKQIREKFLQSQAQQEEQLKLQQRMLAQELARQKEMGVLGNLDLRPFAQAAKQYGAQTAVVPTAAPEERTEVMQKLQEQIQRGQRGLTQDQIGFLRTMMEEKRSAQAGLSAANLDKRLFDTARNEIMKPVNDLQKATGQYNFVKGEILSGQPSRINRALSQYARIMGQTGVLTDNDIRLQLPSTFVGALDRAYSFVTGNVSGAQLPEDIVQDLLKTLDEGNSQLKAASDNKVDTIYSSFATEFSPYAAQKWLPGLYTNAKKGIAGPKQKEVENKSLMPPSDAIEAEAKRRAAAKKGK